MKQLLDRTIVFLEKRQNLSPTLTRDTKILTEVRMNIFGDSECESHHAAARYSSNELIARSKVVEVESSIILAVQSLLLSRIA